MKKILLAMVILAVVGLPVIFASMFIVALNLSPVAATVTASGTVVILLAVLMIARTSALHHRERSASLHGQELHGQGLRG